MEVRYFFRLLNRSSWDLHYKSFSTKVQNLKFVWCKAEILKKVLKNFRAWFAIFSEISSVAVRSFFKLLNRSSWHFRYKFVSMKPQKLKFLGCKAEIPRKIF